LGLARCVVDEDWSYRGAAIRFHVAVTSVRRWVLHSGMRSAASNTDAPDPKPTANIERFHRTLADELAHARLYTSDTERCEEFRTLAPHLRSPPRPHLTRRPTTRHPHT
jgi:hypothetical protein